MIGILPECLEVGGKQIPINADFRNILTIFEALADDKLTDREKAYITVRRLYKEPFPSEYALEAVEKAYWFLDGGDMPKSKTDDVKTIDWKHDESMIMPAVSKAMSVLDVRALSYLHWWSFLGSFGEIGEGLFSTVVNLRQKKARGEKLTKTEERFWRKNKAVCKLVTPEEQSEIDAAQELLKKYI